PSLHVDSSHPRAKCGQDPTFIPLVKKEPWPNMKRRTSPALIAFGAIVIFGGASVLLGYSAGWLGSRLEERCQDYCAARGKQGQMAPVYPKTMTGSRDRPAECGCR
ncbi:hypothetical protein, partial [Variovorax beijingensis]